MFSRAAACLPALLVCLLSVLCGTTGRALLPYPSTEVARCLPPLPRTTLPARRTRAVRAPAPAHTFSRHGLHLLRDSVDALRAILPNHDSSRSLCVSSMTVLTNEAFTLTGDVRARTATPATLPLLPLLPHLTINRTGWFITWRGHTASACPVPGSAIVCLLRVRRT